MDLAVAWGCCPLEAQLGLENRLPRCLGGLSLHCGQEAAVSHLIGSQNGSWLLPDPKI